MIAFKTHKMYPFGFYVRCKIVYTIHDVRLVVSHEALMRLMGAMNTGCTFGATAFLLVRDDTAIFEYKRA